MVGRHVQVKSLERTLNMSCSDIFENIFSTPYVSSIWSDRTRTANYLRFEGCLARVQGDLNIIPGDAAAQICAWCADVDNIDFEELKRTTEKIGYPVLGLVQQIVRQVNIKHPGLGEWAHYGATTQVTLPTTRRYAVIDWRFGKGRNRHCNCPSACVDTRDHLRVAS